MRFVHSISAVLALASSIQASAVAAKRSIDQSLFDEMKFYYQYASSAYKDSCQSPNGNTLIQMINNPITDTQGFVARDDSRKEIVVSLRGTSSVQDALTDSGILYAKYDSPGVSPPPGTKVHSGFLLAWNSVASEIISLVSEQLSSHPDYWVVTSGHSLGGALSSLAGISMRQNFPNSATRMYTFGQPRTGDASYADFVNEQFGSDNLHRVVHTVDGVPTAVPRNFGYVHHGVEYWLTTVPASAESTRQCDPIGEDPTCSDILPSGGINAAHLTYFDTQIGTPFCT